jgi:Tfp pilus assembly protein PilO
MHNVLLLYFSAKIGKMEDLEDMRREEEELKAKARKKMRR